MTEAQTTVLKAIKGKLDGWLGMVGKDQANPNDPTGERHSEIHYFSPTNILLFTVHLYWYRNNWRLSHRSISLPIDVDTLRTLSENCEPAALAAPVFQGD